jgi:hypothetical protein
MHAPINVKSPNNTSKWQMEFNSAFKGLKKAVIVNWLIVEVHWWASINEGFVGAIRQEFLKI